MPYTPSQDEMKKALIHLYDIRKALHVQAIKTPSADVRVILNEQMHALDTAMQVIRNTLEPHLPIDGPQTIGVPFVWDGDDAHRNSIIMMTGIDPAVPPLDDDYDDEEETYRGIPSEGREPSEDNWNQGEVVNPEDSDGSDEASNYE